MTEDLDAAKAALRKEIFARRKAAHLDGAGAAQSARDLFLQHVRTAAAPEIAGYRPIRTEIDPTPLMQALHDGGARLSVPVIEAAGLPLRFHRWTPDAAMIEGPFGAWIPADGEEVAPTLFITPLVGFDRAGGRLGYGGGFYDRSFAAAASNRAITAIGFAYAAQEVDEIPRAPTDRRLDVIVTEKEVFHAPA